MSQNFNVLNGGMLATNSAIDSTWDARTIPAADLTSAWTRCNSKDGYMSFHYFLENTDYVGVIRIQAHNSPDNTSLQAVDVELSDGTTGVNVATGTNASGFIHVSKNKANYFRMFLDYTSGTATGNKITAVVYQ